MNVNSLHGRLADRLRAGSLSSSLPLLVLRFCNQGTDRPRNTDQAARMHGGQAYHARPFWLQNKLFLRTSWAEDHGFFNRVIINFIAHCFPLSSALARRGGRQAALSAIVQAVLLRS